MTTEINDTVKMADQIARLERELEYRRQETAEADQILGRLVGYPEYPHGSGNVITAPHTLLSLCDEVKAHVAQLVDRIKTLELL